MIFTVHFAATWFMVGLIWIIQLVHYPSFHWVDESRFSRFAQFHSSSISKIVMPVMIVELLTGLILIVNYEEIMMQFNLVALILIWLVTMFLSVPCHKKLAEGYNPETVDSLVSSNWLRTILWSIRGIGLAFYL